MKSLYTSIRDKNSKRQKSFAVLLDPDKLDESACKEVVALGLKNKIDYFFVGGSLLTADRLAQTIKIIKEESDIPSIIFPGSNTQVCKEADAILLLSLISGRNADALIGQHVVAAPVLKQSGLEILPTGYMLIDSGRQTTASYISNTTPIPHDKPSIAACTAMAGEMLGLKLIYLDGGSGAFNTVSPEMIRLVRKSVEVPIIVGGGINTGEKAQDALLAGADLIVVGNGIEKRASLLPEISAVVKRINTLNEII
ncbi:MAG TPA: geranylgeranylglyceryl/heptaprenylglyceryl phosphate synthase [Cytophagaceae bacterium]|jgi:phosphoglycerol geranylgeranyltransferase|nr:geranylgeranylglyceryl/heptaprenylglyceryl phosphate synthase [Cytophagaceae bacterium]